MDLDKIPNTLDKIQDIFIKNGYLRTLLTFMLCVIMFFIGAVTWKITSSDLIDKALQSLTEKSRDLDNFRKELNPKINALLDKTRLETRADRAFIFEYHNGTSSLIGIPFLYVDMTYESYGSGILPYVDEFSKLNTSKFPIFEYVQTHKYWNGTIEQLEKIDFRFSSRLKTEGIKYVFIRAIPTENTGCTVLAYNSDIKLGQKEISDIRYNQGILGHSLSQLFDFSNKKL